MKEKTLQESGGKPEESCSVWEQIRRGDKKAFAALFESSSDRLYRYGTKFVNDNELVKDCIQELFTRLYQNRENLPGVENPIFFLFTLLRHILIDALRKKDKLVYLSPEELSFHISIIWDQDGEEAEDEDESIREQFNAVVALLSERQKEAIYLRFKAGLSYDEIAGLLGINYQSARNLIHRSIEKIRSQMGLNLFLILIA
ncbi:MAG: sigma-70 family RNA polymerase sigma factor [Tannerellaceae bacterium]|jgi:RNA polymerase sigma factor (sigma-70 family)|nr:sigma-70 family RNA polymerase sigma factor [Tannerellaceae bacterium]